jgi:very-short-patch-repair endonuclease
VVEIIVDWWVAGGEIVVEVDGGQKDRRERGKGGRGGGGWLKGFLLYPKV